MQEQQCLYHFPICPFCRKIRFILALNEVNNCYYRIENFWEKREKFCRINPSGEVPVFAIQRDDFDGKKSMVLWGQNTIIDYALHSNKKDLKEIIDILVQQNPNREQVISDKANYILSNLPGIRTIFKEVKGGCCMEQEIQHTLQSCFTSVPKAFSKKNLSTYVKARIHHQNNVDLRIGYLKAWDTEQKPTYSNSSYDFSMFDKREDTHSYYLNFHRKTY